MGDVLIGHKPTGMFSLDAWYNSSNEKEMFFFLGGKGGVEGRHKFSL